jgi:hypothetical protein
VACARLAYKQGAQQQPGSARAAAAAAASLGCSSSSRSSPYSKQGAAALARQLLMQACQGPTACHPQPPLHPELVPFLQQLPPLLIGPLAAFSCPPRYMHPSVCTLACVPTHYATLHPYHISRRPFPPPPHLPSPPPPPQAWPRATMCPSP